MIKSRKIFSVWFYRPKKSMILKMGPNLKYFPRFNQLIKIIKINMGKKICNYPSEFSIDTLESG